MSYGMAFGMNFLTFSLPLLVALAFIVLAVVIIGLVRVSEFGDDVPRFGDE